MCACLLLILLGCSSPEETKAKHFEKAKEYIAKNELRKAVIELKNVVQLDPNDAAAYVELGEAYLKLKEPREAFQAYSRAVSANPENLKAQLKLGQMLLLGRQTDEAKKKAEMILAKSPDNVEALSPLSGVQVQERDLDGAIKTLEKAASVNPNHFNTQLSLGRLLLLRRRTGKSGGSLPQGHSAGSCLRRSLHRAFTHLRRQRGSGQGWSRTQKDDPERGLEL